MLMLFIIQPVSGHCISILTSATRPLPIVLPILFIGAPRPPLDLYSVGGLQARKMPSVREQMRYMDPRILTPAIRSAEVMEDVELCGEEANLPFGDDCSIQTVHVLHNTCSLFPGAGRLMALSVGLKRKLVIYIYIFYTY